MDDVNFEPAAPEYYEIIPEFNSAGRLCNHGSGTNEKVKVHPDEWERGNQTAFRQHKIVDGWVVYDETLEPCSPDDAQKVPQRSPAQIQADVDYVAVMTGVVL